MCHSRLLLAKTVAIPEQQRLMKARFLLVENVKALLVARQEDQQALARWAGHSPPWLSKILNGDRGMSLKDVDKIADFFGLAVSDLFLPGISALTERRRGQRRGGRERRSGLERRGTRPELHADAPRFPRKVYDRDEDSEDDE